MDWQFEQIAGGFTLTEGPVWDGGGLLFTDIGNSRIMRWDAKTSDCVEVRRGTNRANGLMFDKAGRLYGCEQGERRIARYGPTQVTEGADPGGVRPSSRDDIVAQLAGVTVIADRFEGRRLNSPNDLAIDSRGRIWFTDPRYGDDRADMELSHESVFRLDPPSSSGAWTIHRVTHDTTRPNGLLVSHDGATLYVAQSSYVPTEPRELRAYPIREDGSVGAFSFLHSFGPHRGIDGMTLDTEGNIVATCGWEVSGPGPMIAVFAPSGRVLATHPVPCKRPTNCVFGDDDLQTLYVTSIDGLVFRTRTDRQGRRWWPRQT